MRALPLAAGTNKGGHYFGPSGAVQTVSDSLRPLFLVINLFLSFLVVVVFLPPLFKTTEGVVVLFQIFAWAPKKNNKNLGKVFFENF